MIPAATYADDIGCLPPQLNVAELKAKVVYPLTSEVEDMELGELLDNGEFAVSAPRKLCSTHAEMVHARQTACHVVALTEQAASEMSCSVQTAAIHASCTPLRCSSEASKILAEDSVIETCHVCPQLSSARPGTPCAMGRSWWTRSSGTRTCKRRLRRRLRLQVRPCLHGRPCPEALRSSLSNLPSARRAGVDAC